VLAMNVVLLQTALRLKLRSKPTLRGHRKSVLRDLRTSRLKILPKSICEESWIFGAIFAAMRRVSFAPEPFVAGDVGRRHKKNPKHTTRLGPP
jgi:hypothetical protein